MGRRWLVGLLMLSVFVIVGIFWQIRDGYVDYKRALSAIENVDNEEERESVTREFFGYEKRVYGGMLLATLPGHVWVMGRDGVRHFRTDMDSVYSVFDGCNEEVLGRLLVGEAGVIERQVTTKMREWRRRVSLGDYVRVYVTTEEQIKDSRGVVGNLREIYGYNFWLFMRWEMEERCAAR